MDWKNDETLLALIKRGKEAQWRPSRLEVAPLEEANHWIDRYSEVARDRFDRLAAEINRIKSEQEGDTSSGTPNR